MADKSIDDTSRLAREEHITELHTREAISRRDESRANVFRGRANRIGDQFKKPSQAASKEALASAKAADELRGNAPPVDPEGTAPGLSDRSGNYAPNAEVAQAGGIGVDSSNTNVDTGAPAETADEAGTASETAPAVIFGHGGAAVHATGEPVGGDGQPLKKRRGRKPKAA